MKRKTTLYFLIVVGIAIISLQHVPGDRNSGQAPMGRTGAPGEGTCAGCHSGGSYSGEMTFQWSDEKSLEYTPGETYTITFTGNYSAPRYGFSMTVLNDDNQPAGSFALINDANTSLQTSSGNQRQYVGQKNASANNTWSFHWTAPNEPVGNVTFYYVINATNANGNTAGDYVETASTTVSPAQVAETFSLSLVSNPAQAGVLSGGGEYEEGEIISITAVAGDGFAFENWTDGENIISTNAEFDYTMPAENKTLTANFVPDGQTDFFTVTFSIMDEDENEIANAVVTLGDIINPAGNYIFLVEEGTYDYLVEKEGYHAVSFEGLTVDEDLTVMVTMQMIDSSIDDAITETLKVYPNPAHDKIKIDTREGSTQIRVFDIAGKMVYSGIAVGNTHAIDISGWKSGLYTVVTVSGLSVNTVKLIKN